MAHRTRIKICGITRPQDALLSEQLGADAVGFVFVHESQRYVKPETAHELDQLLAPFISRVGLFLDQPQDEIETVLQLVPNMVPQFHGKESPEQCERLFDRFRIPYIKAIGLGSGMPLKAIFDEYENAGAFLFDSNEPGELGGTGHVFDWRKLDSYTGKPMILAGGLHQENVASAIQQTRPYAIDVSSGVEASKGMKDAVAMRAFFDAARHADAVAAGVAD